MFDNSYYSKEVLADFLAFSGFHYLPRLASGTAKTDPELLTGKILPDKLREQRALALGFAMSRERSAKLRDLMLENKMDICFQLYGLCSELVSGLADAILRRHDLTLDEINVLLYFANAGWLQTSSLNQSDSIKLLFYKAENLVEENHELILTGVFWEICELPKEIPFFHRLHDLLCWDYDTVVRATKFLEKRGFTLWELRNFFVMNKQPLNGIDSVIINRLMESCREWTDEELTFVADKLASHNQILHGAICRIAKLQNYKSLWEKLGYTEHPEIYRVGIRDQYTAEKLSLFTEEQQKQVLSVSLKAQPTIASLLPIEYTGLLQSIFSKKDTLLTSAWKECWKRLDGCYHLSYLLNFLNSKEAAEEFISELTWDTIEFFMDFIDSRIVQQELLNLCRKTGEFTVLADFVSVFCTKEQKEISKMLKINKSGRNTNLPEDAETHDLPISLQVFAAKIGATFDCVSDEDKVFVGNAVRGFDFDCNGITEEIVVDAIEKTSFATICREQIFRSALQFGTDFVNNYYIYFVDCSGYEKKMDRSVVCSDYFKYKNASNSIEDARLSQGRRFKRTHDSYETISDNTLDFFQWCGTDEYWTDIHEVDKVLGCKLTDYAKFFVKSVFGKDIDMWNIEQHSDLLNCNFLKRVDWTRNQVWLCKSYSSDMLNPPVPDIAMPFIPASYYLNAVSANLKRHSLDWYQSWCNWEKIILYNFDWDEFTCFYANNVISSGIHTYGAFMQHLYKKAGYEFTLNDPDAAVQISSK